MSDRPSLHDAARKLLDQLGTDGRLEISCARPNALNILARSATSEKFYWSDRKRTFEWLGLGISAHPQQGDCIRFCAVPFASCETQIFTPLVEVRTTAEETILAVNDKTAAIPILRELVDVDCEKQIDPLKASSSQCRLSGFEQFRDKFNHCKKLLSENKLDKVVLANAHDFFFDEELSPALLLQFLDQRSPHTYRFLMQLSKGRAFIGASPELLFSRRGRRIESEAQAGTRPRGRNPAEDSALTFELLESQKEFIEHDLVIQDIDRALAPLCVDSGWIDQRQIIKLSHVQHLRSRFGGILKPSVSDSQILETLHPTAAVCGSPKSLARAVIQELEGFDRGYYGGALGLVSKEQTELAVGLRSALVEQNRVRIYAGAGLVAGSRAEDEWDEIDSKMQLYHSALGQPCS